MKTKNLLKGIARLMFALVVVCGLSLAAMGTEVKAADPAMSGSDGGVTITVDSALVDHATVKVSVGGKEIISQSITTTSTTFSNADIISKWDSSIPLTGNKAKITATVVPDSGDPVSLTTPDVYTNNVYKVSVKAVTGATVELGTATKGKTMSDKKSAFLYADGEVTCTATETAGYALYDWDSTGVTINKTDLKAVKISAPTADATITTKVCTIAINPSSLEFVADGVDHEYEATLVDSSTQAKIEGITLSWSEKTAATGISYTANNEKIKLKASKNAGPATYTATAKNGAATVCARNFDFTAKEPAKPGYTTVTLVDNSGASYAVGSQVMFAADNLGHKFSLKLTDASGKDVTSSYLTAIDWEANATRDNISWTKNQKDITVAANEKFGKTIIKAYIEGVNEKAFTFVAVPSIKDVVTAYQDSNAFSFIADGSLNPVQLKVLGTDNSNITDYCTITGTNRTASTYTHSFDAAKKQATVSASKAGTWTESYTATRSVGGASKTSTITYNGNNPTIAITGFATDEDEYLVNSKVTFALTTNMQPASIMFYPTEKKANGKKISVKSGQTSFTWTHTYSAKGDYEPWVEVVDYYDKNMSAVDSTSVTVYETLGLKITNASPVVLTCGQTVNITGKVTDDIIDSYTAKEIDLTVTKTGYLKEGTTVLDTKNNTVTIPITSEKSNEAYTNDDLKVFLATTDDAYESDNSAIVHIYKKPSCVKTTNSGETQSAVFHIPTHVGTIKTTNMTVTGYVIKIFKDNNCVKTIEKVGDKNIKEDKDSLGKDVTIKLNDIMDAIGSVASGDSYTFRLAVQPVGKINNAGDIVDAKTVDSSNNEIDFISDMSTEFTVYRLNLTADTGITVAADRTWGVAGQKVGIKATGTVGYWTKNGVKIEGTDGKQSYEMTLSATTADNKIGAVLGAQTPAVPAGPGGGSTEGLDEVPKTAESNAPIWLIIVLVFAAMGGGYALYMQMKPAKSTANNARSPFVDDDYDDNF